jgi:hypothetical protein
LLVTSFDGVPIKIEGNLSHPSSWTIKGKQGVDALPTSILEIRPRLQLRSWIDRSMGSAGVA